MCGKGDFGVKVVMIFFGKVVVLRCGFARMGCFIGNLCLDNIYLRFEGFQFYAIEVIEMFSIFMQQFASDETF